jgi:hypothetical protein
MVLVLDIAPEVVPDNGELLALPYWGKNVGIGLVVDQLSWVEN